MRVDDHQAYEPIGARTLAFRETALGPSGAVQASEGGRSLAMSSHVKKVVVIESRVFVRDCLVRAIHACDMNVVGVASVEDALEESTNDDAALFLISVAGRQKIEQQEQDIARLLSETKAPVTVLGDGENPDEIVRLFNIGAVGYISTDLPVRVVAESLRLVLAGGKFIPPSVLLTARAANGPQIPPLEQYKHMFTERQLAVLQALSIGKANKIIANDLKMKESAVKLYVRNLMKVLKARNRTELALIVTEQIRHARKLDL
jgi:DNA-binding NarL/FixJ family response regulator